MTMKFRDEYSKIGKVHGIELYEFKDPDDGDLGVTFTTQRLQQEDGHDEVYLTLDELPDLVKEITDHYEDMGVIAAADVDGTPSNEVQEA